jgi:hypothetical protein
VGGVSSRRLKTSEDNVIDDAVNIVLLLQELV